MNFEVYKIKKKLLSKYRNKETKCLLKHLHDSKVEADECNRLLADRQNKRIRDFKVQVPFPLPGCVHIVDFLVFLNDGSREVRDTKGFKTSVWRLKHKLFVLSYPDIPYRVIERKDTRRKPCRKIPKKLKAMIYR
jgi:hypothetical protein